MKFVIFVIYVMMMISFCNYYGDSWFVMDKMSYWNLIGSVYV